MTSPTYTLHHGDCLDVLRGMADDSVDSVVTDPPYGLSDHKPAEVVECLKAWLAGEPYTPKGKGFMGKGWDAWVPGPEVWRECLRVLKPGGHLLAFAGTRSMDLMCMSVRLAGFELRDSIGYAHDGGDPTQAPIMAWSFGSGFPKSMDVSKAIDKAAGASREVVGNTSEASGRSIGAGTSNGFHGGIVSGHCRDITEPATDAARQWQGWGTALKPAWEPIILARKPLIGTVAANVLAHGTGGLHIDACRVPTDDKLGGGDQSASTKAKTEGWARPWMQDAGAKAAHADRVNANVERAEALGRWPANLITDGSPEVVALFPATGKSTGGGQNNGDKFGGGYAPSGDASIGYGDAGSAARFFYAAKASKKDRGEGNTHVTVKPTDLMRYLCRLVTPPGGIVLDPFTGSGSTGKAAILEGFRFIGAEREAEYIAIARARIEAAMPADQLELQP